jgi:extracellular elastinolytic metalloproteinase
MLNPLYLETFGGKATIYLFKINFNFMKKVTRIFTLGIFCACSLQLVAQDFSQKIQDQLNRRVENNELSATDLKWRVTDQHVSSISGIQNVYFQQEINGIPIFGTQSSMHVANEGTVIAVHDRFVALSNVRSVSQPTPGISALDAVQAAAGQLGYGRASGVAVQKGAQGPLQKTVLTPGDISLSPIPAQLAYLVTEANELALVWDLSIEETSRLNWWSVKVDATTGRILKKDNWMVSCNFEHDHDSHEETLDYHANLFDIPDYSNPSAETAGCNDCYEVFAFPLESPYYGNRSVLTNPAHPTASPYGWHDTNGAPGAEFNTTRGNNVDAFDANTNYRPNGGPGLEFTGYPFNQVYTGSNQYEDAAITNLFYVNNSIHDVLYQYGFDEAAGNFQENNYGNGGSGSDSVNANAQISSWCNATFGTPGDGSNPTMNMYICNDKDGCFDNLVVAHEYAHGISNRLTGGPSQSSCLQNEEQMGEGWSDFYGAILTIEPGDVAADARAVGTYLFGQGIGGGGIRDYPYSTDMGVNPQTYDFIKSASVPHGVGSVWAMMLWEMTWALIDEHGFDPDIYNFTGDVNQDAGNVMAMALVTEGMKLQPCSPGFVDGRDAILAADAALYGGANECLIWDAFAKRGLGVSATQGSTNSRSDGTQAFDTPSGIAQLNVLEEACASSDVISDLSGGTPFGGVYSGPGVTDDGNGQTFSFDPNAAGVGVHTISYEVAAGSCTVASTATDEIEVLAVDDGPFTLGASDICPGDEVTVSATPIDPANDIYWYDAITGGNLLAQGADYTFTPTGNVDVYAQERPAGPISKLVISEMTFETPDRLELQNVGEAFDYTGYTVAVSDQPYTDINSMNSVVQTLGAMGANSVVTWSDQTGSDYWGSNIWWGAAGTGWILVIDPSGNVVDSVFWNFSEAEIATFNVTVNGFNITAADLDWIGDGASLNITCNNSFRRKGDTDSAADFEDICETSNFGTPNSDIGDVSGFLGCLSERSLASVTVETEAPELTCPDDETVSINPGATYTVPDYTLAAIVTDNCTDVPTMVQSPAAGAQVGEGDTEVTITATDEAGNETSCTFTLTVVEVLGTGDAAFNNNIRLFPNPVSEQFTIANFSNEVLTEAVITDVNGRIVQRVALTEGAMETVVSVETLSAGMYFVKIHTAQSTLVKRILKK